MINITDGAVSSASTTIRELTAAEGGAHFPGVASSSIAIGLLLGDGVNGALAFGPEPFDSAQLGLRIGRIVSTSARCTVDYAALLKELTRRARRDGYDQVLRRTALNNLEEVWALESCGFELMDVGLTFARSVHPPLEPPVHDDLLIRSATPEDIEQIIPPMVQQPWATRYESDPAYEPARVRELRARWLWNSHQGRADIFFVGVLDGQPAGYVTGLSDRRSGHGQIELVGTLPAFRGRRVAARVLAHALSWFSTRTTFVTVRTQATNFAAAALYESAGFTLYSSDMTLRLTVDHDGDSR